MEEKPSVIFVLGGPGSGKGTQCTKIQSNFGYVHLSAGDLLRKQRNSGSQSAELIQSFISKGQIVPVKITCGLLKKAMQQSGWNGGKFLIDGFPRNQDNYDGWKQVMGDLVNIKFVLFFDCPEEFQQKVLVDRLMARGRQDDDPQIIKARFQVYMNDSKPIIQKYKELGKLKKIDSSGTPQQVFDSLKELF